MLSDCTDQLLAARSLDFGQGQAGSVRFKSAIPPGVDWGETGSLCESTRTLSAY